MNKKGTNKIIEINEENINSYVDQLSFDTLVEECTLEDLCISYGITIEDMLVLVHELKKRGSNVQLLNTSASVYDEELNDYVMKKATVIKNFGHRGLIDDLSYKIENNDKNIKCMLLSDLRFGSVYEQISILNELYVNAKNMGVKYVFVVGDFVEGTYSGSKDIYNLSLHKVGAQEQSNYVISNYPRVDGITTYFITGEHDLSFLKSKEKVDIGKAISLKREDIIYLGQKRKKVSFISPSSSSEITMYLQHSQGNVPYTISYKPQQKISSFRNEDKTDILVTGHFGYCDAFLRRGVQSYQVPTLVRTTNEMKDAHTPVYNTVGAWIITINKDKKNNFKSTSSMFIPYYKTIENDYKNYKPLYISDDVKVPFFAAIPKDDKDKIYQKISNKDTVSDVCKRFNITPLKLGGLIEEFKLRDYDIDITNDEYISKKRQYRSAKNIKSSINKLEKISFTVISDTHLCNESQQLNFINKVYKESYDRGIDTVLHCGDITDGFYKGRDDQLYELFRIGAVKQAQYVAENYPYVEGINTYFITGNHDLTHVRNGGIDIGEEIVLRRNALGLNDMFYIGSERALFNPGDSKTSILMTHPGGGCAASLSYRMQKLIEKMEPGNKPNIVLTGHYHQSHFLFDRNVFALLIPCLTAKSPFVLRQGLENTMGAYYITLYVNNNGDIEMLEYDEKRFKDIDCKNDDWYKSSSLILKK